MSRADGSDHERARGERRGPTAGREEQQRSQGDPRSGRDRARHHPAGVEPPRPFRRRERRNGYERRGQARRERAPRCGPYRRGVRVRDDVGQRVLRAGQRLGPTLPTGRGDEGEPCSDERDGGPESTNWMASVGERARGQDGPVRHRGRGGDPPPTVPGRAATWLRTLRPATGGRRRRTPHRRRRS